MGCMFIRPGGVEVVVPERRMLMLLLEWAKAEGMEGRCVSIVTGVGEWEVVRAWAKSFPRLPSPRMWIGVGDSGILESILDEDERGLEELLMVGGVSCGTRAADGKASRRRLLVGGMMRSVLGAPRMS